ncbi:MAG: hypothetical protein AAFV80_23530, partial [Bacteroidota bacterium]
MSNFQKITDYSFSTICFQVPQGSLNSFRSWRLDGRLFYRFKINRKENRYTLFFDAFSGQYEIKFRPYWGGEPYLGNNTWHMKLDKKT